MCCFLRVAIWIKFCFIRKKKAAGHYELGVCCYYHNSSVLLLFTRIEIEGKIILLFSVSCFWQIPVKYFSMFTRFLLDQNNLSAKNDLYFYLLLFVKLVIQISKVLLINCHCDIWFILPAPIVFSLILIINVTF